jgi:hypothetical protein
VWGAATTFSAFLSIPYCKRASTPSSCSFQLPHPTHLVVGFQFI